MKPITLDTVPERDDTSLACQQCGHQHSLFVRVGEDGMACPGSPLIPMEPAPLEVQEVVENEIRKRMTARGGADRHLVRKGST